ncbi:class I SAM-dependent methyltransferase family protein [Methanolapillus millepedarum]|uniref:SAM-dependent methyltransferase TRM5/TYW2-type domain-containing protein n=1 Tax=Methanolapillus millepedarum TaxID=3028296 RepID=A0AA96V474_9EURY|nr:hypothetical protein MsAc7_09560 [Methanosarcinaceae archaeon Ac7]
MNSNSKLTFSNPAFRVLKKDGEPCRRLLDELFLLNYSARPFADDVYLYLPLTRRPNGDELSTLFSRLSHLESFALVSSFSQEGNESGFENILLEKFVVDAAFSAQEKQPTVFDILGYAVAYEMVGDIAVIDDKSVSEKASETVSEIAAAILAAHSGIRTVLLSRGPVSGEFRIRDLEFIAGADKTATVHKEYGCIYNIDLARAYFTPRLSTERSRILSQIHADDFVIDMFAGVGPYSVLIAKNAQPKTVIANDKNEAAVSLLVENIAQNKVKNVVPLNLDAVDLAKEYAGTGDHVIMNLPHNACDFLDTAVKLTKAGGIIHYYAMTSDDDLFDGEIEKIRATAEKQRRSIEVIEKRTVRSYAPHQYNICLDVRIC